MLRSMQLKALNPHITCVLCGGYLVDATTIIECLHSFCRSCIILWLERSYDCPVCETEIHKTRPFLNIRPDRVLQDIVNKLVPGFYHNELQRRQDFAEEEQEWSGEQEKKTKSVDLIQDPVCVILEYYRSKKRRKENTMFPCPRYLRCSSQVTIIVLKKFLLTKFGVPSASHETEIVRSDEILGNDMTIKDITRIYGLHTKPFIDLQYVFISKDDTDPATTEPYEVQLPRQKRQQQPDPKTNKFNTSTCSRSDTVKDLSIRRVQNEPFSLQKHLRVVNHEWPATLGREQHGSV